MKSLSMIGDLKLMIEHDIHHKKEDIEVNNLKSMKTIISPEGKKLGHAHVHDHSKPKKATGFEDMIS